MDPDLARASQFISRLLENSTLSGLTPLQKEEQILLFLSTNARQLYPAFPGKTWAQIEELLINALRQETDRQLEPLAEAIARREINFTFVSFLQSVKVPVESCQEQMWGVLKRLLQKQETRQAFAGPFAAAYWKLPDRYLEKCFLSKQYVHFELTKVERLRMGHEELTNLLRAALLLKPAVLLLSAGEAGARTQGSGLVERQFAEKAFAVLREQVKALPAALLRSALNSNVSFLEHPGLEASARLVAIFSTMARSLRPGLKVDRGAGSAERSWLGIARRNYKLYGFDGKMLDELYKEAAQNGW